LVIGLELAIISIYLGHFCIEIWTLPRWSIGIILSMVDRILFRR
jgi:hypothetical protein